MWPFEKLHPHPTSSSSWRSPTAMMDFSGDTHFQQFQKGWDFCEHNWWYSSMLLEKTHVFFLWSCTRTKKANAPDQPKIWNFVEMTLGDEDLWQYLLSAFSNDWGIPQNLLHLVVALATSEKNAKVTQTIISQTFLAQKLQKSVKLPQWYNMV